MKANRSSLLGPYEQIIKITICALLFIYLVIHFYQPIEFEDFWWHIKTGEWISLHLQVPQTDLFPFHGEQTPWIFMQWLGSLMYYLIYSMGGVWGIKLFRCLLFLAITAIFFFYALKRKQVAWPLLILICLFWAYGVGARSHLRPFVFNYIFVQLFLIQLFAYQQSINYKNLLALPLLGILWANINIGSFVYGTFIISAFLMASIIQYFNVKLSNDKKDRIGPAMKPVKELFLLLLIYLCIFFINPYGIHGASYIFKLFLVPQSADFFKYSNLISEFMPPAQAMLSTAGFWVLFFSLFVMVSLFISNKNTFLKVILFLGALFIFLRGSRGVAFFSIISSYIIIESITGYDLYELITWPRLRKMAVATLCTGMVCFLIVHIIKEFNQNIYINNRTIRYRSLAYNPFNPVTAIDFLQKHNIHGNVLNDNMYGGYILWAGYPHLKPMVDGRHLNKKRVDLFISALRNPQKIMPALEDQFNVNIVLLDSGKHFYTRILKYLQTQKSWQLIFVDGSSVMYLKKGTFKLPLNAEQLEESLSHPKVSSTDVQDLEELLQRGSESKTTNIFNPEPGYIDVLEEGAALFDLGYRTQAIKLFTKSIEISNQPMTRGRVSRALMILKNYK